MPETPRATRSYEHSVRVEAAPETVFAYFTDPAKLVRWMGNGATLDPRPGGICRIEMKRDLGEGAMVGEFTEVVPYSRVVFTWGWEDDLFGVPPASTRVEVSLVPEDGGTLVRLVHRELPEEAVEAHQAGWTHYLRRLSVAAAGGELAPDDWIAPGITAPGAPG